MTIVDTHQLRSAVDTCRSSLTVLDARIDALGAHAHELRTRLRACAARLGRALTDIEACLPTA